MLKTYLSVEQGGSDNTILFMRNVVLICKFMHEGGFVLPTSPLEMTRLSVDSNLKAITGNNVSDILIFGPGQKRRQSYPGYSFALCSSLPRWLPVNWLLLQGRVQH